MSRLLNGTAEAMPYTEIVLHGRRASRRPHRTEKLEHQVRCQDGSDLPGAVEERRHLYDVAADQLKAGKAANEPERFVAREPAYFRRTRPWGERRIDGIDVEGHVGRPGDDT